MQTCGKSKWKMNGTNENKAKKMQQKHTDRQKTRVKKKIDTGARRNENCDEIGEMPSRIICNVYIRETDRVHEV